MEQFANYYLAKHHACKTDYLEKYRNTILPGCGPRRRIFNPNAHQALQTLQKVQGNKGSNAGSEFWAVQLSQMPGDN
jgi:hypothetical protein